MSRASAALLLGASSMFATMYSTQAILPEISSDLDVSAAVAGLTVSVVVLAVALGGWVHGPLSDRIGRRRVMVASAGMLTASRRCVNSACCASVSRSSNGAVCSRTWAMTDCS